MPDNFDADINSLLEQAQAASEIVREFAWLRLRTYRQEALAAARSALALTERVRLVNEARDRLRDSLRRLLEWGRSSGRM